jgi:hypothetical protein
MAGASGTHSPYDDAERRHAYRERTRAGIRARQADIATNVLRRTEPSIWPGWYVE